MAKPIVAVAVVAAGALGLAACASGSCGGSGSGGGGGKTLIISTDLPLQGSNKDASDSTNQAIQLYLDSIGQQGRQLHDQAAEVRRLHRGRGEVGPARSARRTPQKHVPEQDEVAVMGTLNSGCAKIEVPILNQDPNGPMLMVSHANTNVGLTQDAGTPASRTSTTRPASATTPASSPPTTSRVPPPRPSPARRSASRSATSSTTTRPTARASRRPSWTDAPKNGIKILGNEPWDPKAHQLHRAVPEGQGLRRRLRLPRRHLRRRRRPAHQGQGLGPRRQQQGQGDRTGRLHRLPGPGKLPQAQGMYLSFAGLSIDQLLAAGGAGAKLLDAYKAKYGRPAGVELRALRRGRDAGHPQGDRQESDGTRKGVTEAVFSEGRHDPGQPVRARQGPQDRPGDG